jgi:hypothetical protein
MGENLVGKCQRPIDDFAISMKYALPKLVTQYGGIGRSRIIVGLALRCALAATLGPTSERVPPMCATPNLIGFAGTCRRDQVAAKARIG